MPTTLQIDPVIVREQIAMLRHALANRRLDDRKRFLVTNLLGVLHLLLSAAEVPDEAPVGAASGTATSGPVLKLPPN